MKDQYNRYKKALIGLEKPCAFIDLDAFEQNVRDIGKQAKGKRIRLASKSIRSVEMIKKILASSSIFKGIMCFTGEEAIYLYEQGLDDLLIAYPIWDEKTLRKICRLTTNGARIVVMVDSLEHIEHLDAIANSENGHFLLCLDIDLSNKIFNLHFGVYRSSIKSLDDLKKMSKHLKGKTTLLLDGLMGYEAQIAGVTDADPQAKAKGILIRILKAYARKKVKKRRKQAVKYLRKHHPFLRFVNGGGTGSLHLTTKEKYVTEVTVGSGFYQSHLFDKYKAFRYQAAAMFAIEVTRQPEKDVYTCHGGGYVASGSAGHDKLPEIYLPKGGSLIANEGVGEVQTPVRYKGSVRLKMGDPIILRHSKAGELCERFTHLHLIRGEELVGKVTTYRGDGQCFL